MRIDSLYAAKRFQLFAEKPKEASAEFPQRLKQAIEALNREHKAASEAAVELAEGKRSDLASVVLALRKTEASFALVVAVRNKLVEAYRELMRMQV